MNLTAIVFLVICLTTTAEAEGWSSYGGDPGGQKFSHLDQINTQNVEDLELAWSFQTGELEAHPDRASFGSFNGTPLILPEEAERSLVFCTPFNKIIALDPTTGTERWRFDSEVDKGPYPTRYNCRGIGYWNDIEALADQVCKHRLFMGTTDLRIFAIDAITGERCADFGDNGEVDMTAEFRAGYPDLAYGDATFSSPPAIIGDRVVFGSSNNVRNTSVASPKGTIRAFDARSGDVAWGFDPVPYDPQDPQHENWTPEALAVTTGANAWSMLSVDEARDLVFVPTGSASPDPYGGLRPGDNRYANSVVALRGSTGEVVWHFQTIHHDVWDWDLPAQPMLVDITRDGATIPAVIQLTKQGLVFTLHRDTGEPIFEVEERPVPQDGAVPGEQLSPTQPFPVNPPPLIETGFTPEDAWGLTFWDEGKCRDMVAAGDWGPLFSPPTLKGRVGMPGMSVTNWGGGAYDAATNTLITTASRAPMKLQLYKLEDIPPPQPNAPPFGAPKLVKGTQYGLATVPLLSPIFMPCSKPPWGQLVSIDMGTGEINWKVTLGTLDTLSPIPIPLKWGTPTSGGPIATAGGLIFIGATMDEKFRAFDLKTGEELWKVSTPTSSMATPMTYEAGGEQYVVIASGGHMWQYSQKLGDWLVAYKLKQ